MCRALALPVPGSPVPGWDRRSRSRRPQSPTGTGAVRPGVPRLRPALPDPSPARTRRGARASPTVATAYPQRQDGTGGPCCGPRRVRGRGEPTPCSCRGFLAASGEKPHGTLAGGMSLRGDAPGWRAGWRPVPALFIYFFTHRVINLCVPGRKARGGGGPCKAVQPACASSGLPWKSPQADPSEMLSLPIALLWQKAVVQNHSRDGAAMLFQQAEPVRQGRAGWALPGHPTRYPQRSSFLDE